MMSQTAIFDLEAIREEQERNNNVFWLARQGFYGQVVGDILKTISGKAIVGAFTLSMCAIAAFAELEYWNKNQEKINADGTVPLPGENNKKLFQDWVNEWPNRRQNKGRLDEPYDSGAVYGIRCALAHAYGGADSLKKAGIDGYDLMRERSAAHCSIKQRSDGKWIYSLNLENFISDLIFAFDDCCQNLIPNKDTSFLNYINTLIVPKRLDASEQFVVVDTQRVSLDSFDTRLGNSPLEVNKLEILEKIRTLGTAVN